MHRHRNRIVKPPPLMINHLRRTLRKPIPSNHCCYHLPLTPARPNLPTLNTQPHTMDDWEAFPLFAPEGAEIPRVDADNADGINPTLGALSHILYDEETPEEISEQHREIGNRLFRRGKQYVLYSSTLIIFRRCLFFLTTRKLCQICNSGVHRRHRGEL